MFITVEGIEGSGKTTQTNLLAAALEREGRNVAITHEPGWGQVGNCLRQVLLDERGVELAPLAELCLFCADRAQHVGDFIRPQLDQGHIVICDRFSDSTVAYQGYGRGLDLGLVKKLAWEAALGAIPDLTILLDLPVELGLGRIGDREGRNKLDEESLRFHSRVRRGYREIAAAEPRRVKLVDASRAREEIAEEVSSLALGALDQGGVR